MLRYVLGVSCCPSSTVLVRETIKFFVFLGIFHLNRMEFAEVKVDNVYFMVPKYPQKFLDQVQNSTFLECNYNRAAKFISHHYDRDDDEGAQTFRSNAKDVLIAAANVLDELKIQFWLSSGTCLSKYFE